MGTLDHCAVGCYPGWAGRYFDNYGKYGWQSGEGYDAYQATGGVLNKIAPVNEPNVTNQTTPGSTGYTIRAQDATATCETIAAAIASGELTHSFCAQTWVYLDVEQQQSNTITPDY